VSAQEIIAELPRLNPDELRQVKAKVEELDALANKSEKTVWEVLREFAGKAKGLPPDLASNHDHYLYGLPKRKP
jgi:hypothetical protein